MKNLINFVLSVAVLIVVLNLHSTNAANIMFFFGVSTYSHRITVWPLVEKLVESGHNITFIQPFHSKKPHLKVKEIFPIEVEEFMKTMKKNKKNWLNLRLEVGKFNIQKIQFKVLTASGIQICEVFLSSQETIEWINNSKIDLVVMDGLFNECGYGFAHKFRSKVIIFGTTSVFSWWYDEFGIPAETNWLPDIIVSFSYPLSYFERTVSTLLTLGIHYYKSVYYFPELEQILRTKLNIPDMPGINELNKKVNLVFMNTHSSEEFARSLPPLIIPIGGMHCDSSAAGKKKSEIPKEISNFIKNEEGFIYVSFGSEANIGEAPEEFQNIFYTAFGNSKIKFVWKWEGARPKQMPPNVITAEWMPQQELLAQPNIIAFISHGGLLSIQEAITFEVPMIVFPVFAEQDYNSYRIERTGRGIHLDVQTLTAVQLQSAILEIQTNKRWQSHWHTRIGIPNHDPEQLQAYHYSLSYKENMRKTATLFKDRPQTPLETAVWWTEYVLRQNDTSHLMPLAVNQSWFERRLLDVWLGIAFVSVLVLVMIYYILKGFIKVISVILHWANLDSKSYKTKIQNKSLKVKRT